MHFSIVIGGAGYMISVKEGNKPALLFKKRESDSDLATFKLQNNQLHLTLDAEQTSHEMRVRRVDANDSHRNVVAARTIREDRTFVLTYRVEHVADMFEVIINISSPRQHEHAQMTCVKQGQSLTNYKIDKRTADWIRLGSL